MGQDIFTGHRITEQGLHIKSEQGEIIIPLDEASKLLSALQRMTTEPQIPQPQLHDNRPVRNSFQRRMKHG